MGSDSGYIIYLLALLVLVGGGIFARQNASKSVRDILIWAGVILVLVLGYNFYEKRAARPQQLANGEYSMRIPYDDYAGGYHTYFQANNVDLEGIIDTGATGVVLTFDDAKKAGIPTIDLSYSVEVSTANGSTRAAATELDTLSFGDVSFFNVPVLVAQDGDLDSSLLGMAILRRAQGFSADGDALYIQF